MNRNSQAVRTYPNFLGHERRQRLITLLDDCQVDWDTSENLGKTGANSTYQVSESFDRSDTRLNHIRLLVGTSVYDAVGDHFNLPDPQDLDLQVFPVLMAGSLETPPSQGPHIDGEEDHPPLVTSVYYAACEELVGGELIVRTSSAASVITPTEDTLVAFVGDQVHEVGNLQSGRRLSFVCNFYLPMTPG